VGGGLVSGEGAAASSAVAAGSESASFFVPPPPPPPLLRARHHPFLRFPYLPFSPSSSLLSHIPLHAPRACANNNY